MVRATPTTYFILRAAIVALNDGGDLLMMFVPKISYLEYYFRNVSEDEAKQRISNAIQESKRTSMRKTKVNIVSSRTTIMGHDNHDTKANSSRDASQGDSGPTKNQVVPVPGTVQIQEI